MEEEEAKLEWQKKNRNKIAKILGDGYQLYFPNALKELATKVWNVIKSFFGSVGNWIKSNLMGKRWRWIFGSTVVRFEKSFCTKSRYARSNR